MSSEPSPRSLRGLDWLNFFIADVRTGVGPFVAIYLTQIHWDLTHIGIALTAAELAGVLSQAPGGAVTDHARSKRALLAAAIAALALCALLLALFPNHAVVFAAQSILGMTGSIFGPGIGAVTLGLVGYSMLGARTGRNAAFGSAGNVVAALSMGLIGYYASTRSIFFFVALLSLPTLAALLAIRGREIDFERARGGAAGHTGVMAMLRDRRILIFLIFTILFHMANGTMLPLLGEMVAASHPRQSPLWMSAAVTTPQIVMALIAPGVGRIADARGRKNILLFGFVFLPLRAVLFALFRDPYLLISFQVFDGIAAGIFGIVGILMIADCTQGTGHYNLAVGIAGVAVGIGASISTALAGVIAQHGGFSPAFLTMAVFGTLAFLVLWIFMPETHPVS